MTSQPLVMDFKARGGAAELTFPSVAAQHLLMKSGVRFCFESDARTFGCNMGHDAFSVTWRKNVCLSSPGRNLKSRTIDCKSTSGFPLSRFAPARKSAQIISRQ